MHDSTETDLSHLNLNNKLLIIYSNLGVGGIPRKIVDLVNFYRETAPDLQIHILLQKQTLFSLDGEIVNPRVTVEYYSREEVGKSPYLFVFRILYRLLTNKPNFILTYISAYAIPTMLCKILLFWIPTRVTIGEDHLTSNMVNVMKLPYIQRLGVHWLYPVADKIIAPSMAIEEDLRNQFSISREKIVVIPNWTTSIKKIPRQVRPIDIIYLGRFAKTKNLDIIVEIIKRVKEKFPRLKAIFLGDGTARADLKNSIRTHALEQNVQIQPPTLNAVKYLSKAKILVYASGNTEGMPLVFLEAMARGTIIISLYFDGIREIIADKRTGFIVQAPKEMLNCVVNLLTNDRSCLKVRNAAFRYVKKHHSKKYLKLYAQQVI